MTVIELPDEQAAALKAKAAAQGLSLEAWFKKLAESGTAAGSVATLDWSQCPAVESVPGKVSGAWVFKNTRMPVSAVFENLEDDISIDELMRSMTASLGSRSRRFLTSLPAVSKRLPRFPSNARSL